MILLYCKHILQTYYTVRTKVEKLVGVTAIPIRIEGKGLQTDIQIYMHMYVHKK